MHIQIMNTQTHAHTHPPPPHTHTNTPTDRHNIIVIHALSVSVSVSLSLCLSVSRRFGDLALKQEEVVELSGFVDIDLDQGSSLGQAQTAVLPTLVHKEGAELQKGLWHQTNSLTKLKTNQRTLTETAADMLFQKRVTTL